MDIKRAWNRPVVRSTHRGFSHCPIQMNRQRQSPRRYELYTIPLETYINNGIMPHIRAQHMLTRSHGRVIKSHPGHLPLLHSRLDLKFCENFCRSQTQRRVNAFYMSWKSRPTQNRLVVTSASGCRKCNLARREPPF